MEKRRILFGTYNTALHDWTLTGWNLAPAEQKTQYLEKPNGDGSWDFSTVLSDGVLRYRDRELTASFECSEGDRMSREAKIRHMVNTLDGMKLEIRLPDDADHYLVGRLHVIREYNDLAHAAVTVTAVCEPWKYSNSETVVEVTASATAQTITLHNSGRRAIVPQLTVTGGSISLKYENNTTTATTATKMWPALLLTPGTHGLEYSGSGTITFKYREAVLE